MKIGILEPKDFSNNAFKKLLNIGGVKKFDSRKTSLRDFIYDKNTLFIRLSYLIDESFLNNCNNLQFICSPTTGLNHIDLETCDNKNIEVLSLKGEFEFLKDIRATAEHSIGLLISLLRNYKRLSRPSEDLSRDQCKGDEIHGSRIGIIGMGRIGLLLAQYINQFGGHVYYFDPFVKIDEKEYKKTNSIIDLISQTKIIFLTASYDKRNEGLIDKKIIDSLKGKIFINTSRGELIDEEYMILKIANGNHFKAIALDVHSNENQQINNSKELVNLANIHDNFLFTPHIGGATYRSMERTEEFICDKFIDRIKN